MFLNDFTSDFILFYSYITCKVILSSHFLIYNYLYFYLFLFVIFMCLLFTLIVLVCCLNERNISYIF